MERVDVIATLQYYLFPADLEQLAQCSKALNKAIMASQNYLLFQKMKIRINKYSHNLAAPMKDREGALLAELAAEASELWLKNILPKCDKAINIGAIIDKRRLAFLRQNARIDINDSLILAAQVGNKAVLDMALPKAREQFRQYTKLPVAALAEIINNGRQDILKSLPEAILPKISICEAGLISMERDEFGLYKLDPSAINYTTYIWLESSCIGSAWESALMNWLACNILAFDYRDRRLLAYFARNINHNYLAFIGLDEQREVELPNMLILAEFNFYLFKIAQHSIKSLLLNIRSMKDCHDFAEVCIMAKKCGYTQWMHKLVPSLVYIDAIYRDQIIKRLEYQLPKVKMRHLNLKHVIKRHGCTRIISLAKKDLLIVEPSDYWRVMDIINNHLPSSYIKSSIALETNMAWYRLGWPIALPMTFIIHDLGEIVSGIGPAAKDYTFWRLLIERGGLNPIIAGYIGHKYANSGSHTFSNLIIPGRAALLKYVFGQSLANVESFLSKLAKFSLQKPSSALLGISASFMVLAIILGK